MRVATLTPNESGLMVGRNAAELRAAALATGTYENYQGDGFSVPWQVALPGSVQISFILLSYKAYLDSHWPEAARLHDWCYTPYGRLINVTRLEADNALYELIAVDSTFHASIVYAAVRAGGGPYFGVSQTGYVGPQSQGPLPDIGVPPRSVGPDAIPNFASRFTGMSIKVVMKFNGFTDRSPATPAGGGGLQQHGYGFTESYWSDYIASTTRSNFLGSVGRLRAALLPSNCSLLEAVLYDGGSGTGVSVPCQFPGGNYTTDQVNIALLCTSQNTTAAHQSRFWIHNLPDIMVQGGEYTPTAAYAQAVQAYFTELGFYKYRGQIPANQRTIFKVAANGLVTTTTPHPFAVGQMIHVNRVYLGNGRKKGGIFTVSDVGPLNTNFTIAGWTFGDGKGGTVFTATYDTLRLQNCVAVRAGTRKVGRPFGEYRGRKSAKKT